MAETVVVEFDDSDLDFCYQLLKRSCEALNESKKKMTDLAIALDEVDEYDKNVHIPLMDAVSDEVHNIIKRLVNTRRLIKDKAGFNDWIMEHNKKRRLEEKAVTVPKK
jgi:uncharacterized protein YdiU (UPF0061 family)